jgi:hypothetical protein
MHFDIVLPPSLLCPILMATISEVAQYSQKMSFLYMWNSVMVNKIELLLCLFLISSQRHIVTSDDHKVGYRE